jgi:hypothetical protein
MDACSPSPAKNGNWSEQTVTFKAKKNHKERKRDLSDKLVTKKTLKFFNNRCSEQRNAWSHRCTEHGNQSDD